MNRATERELTSTSREMGKLIGNAKAQKLAREFLQAVDDAYVAEGFPDTDNLRDHIFVNSKFYKKTEPLVTADYALAEGIVDLIGPTVAHHEDVRDTAWTVASATVEEPRWRKLLEQLETICNAPQDVVLPCYNTILEGLEELRLGPVRLVTNESLRVRFNRDELPWQLREGTNPGAHLTDTKIAVELPRFCWVVSVASAIRNAQILSQWFVDVATSLLRFHIPPELRSKAFPSNGATEEDPFEQLKASNATLVFRTGGARIGDIPASRYEVSSKTFSLGQLNYLDSIGSAVLFPRATTVAERLYRGLGWLTRARRSRDPAQRFLMFFTALEALLAGESAGGGVTDHLTRAAATILTNDHAQRAMISKELQLLYATRSALVHRGDRQIGQLTALNLERWSEAVYIFVLNHVRLSLLHSKFLADIKQASFGSRWPPENQDYREAHIYLGNTSPGKAWV